MPYLLSRDVQAFYLGGWKKLNWWKIFPYQYINAYPFSIVVTLLLLRYWYCDSHMNVFVVGIFLTFRPNLIEPITNHVYLNYPTGYWPSNCTYNLTLYTIIHLRLKVLVCTVGLVKLGRLGINYMVILIWNSILSKKC